MNCQIQWQTVPNTILWSALRDLSNLYFLRFKVRSESIINPTYGFPDPKYPKNSLKGKNWITIDLSMFSKIEKGYIGYEQMDSNPGRQNIFISSQQIGIKHFSYIRLSYEKLLNNTYADNDVLGH